MFDSNKDRRHFLERHADADELDQRLTHPATRVRRFRQGSRGRPGAHRVHPLGGLYGVGLFWPLMRELRETEYQFRDDFVMDSLAARTAFGLEPTPWEDVVAATVLAR